MRPTMQPYVSSQARISLRSVLRASGLVGRGPAPRPKDYVGSFAPPSAEVSSE